MTVLDTPLLSSSAHRSLLFLTALPATAKVIDRHLSKGCKAAIRVAAFEVLLMFISNIKANIDEQLFLFQHAINPNPFQGRSGLEGTLFAMAMYPALTLYLSLV